MKQMLTFVDEKKRSIILVICFYCNILITIYLYSIFRFVLWLILFKSFILYNDIKKYNNYVKVKNVGMGFYKVLCLISSWETGCVEN